MKPSRTNTVLCVHASILALVISACDEPEHESGDEQVATVDVMVTLAPQEIPPPGVRTMRVEGTMQLCAADESYEVRVVRGMRDEGDGCRTFPIVYVHDEGSFPRADAMIDGTEYPATEIHLARHAGAWFLFIEGSHDESVMNEHYGAVFQVDGGDEIELVSKCSGHIRAWDEDIGSPYLCIRDVLHSLDLALVKWTEDNSCVIDYSFCPSAPA